MKSKGKNIVPSTRREKLALEPDNGTQVSPFLDRGSVSMENVRVTSMSPLIAPSKFPIGKILMGKFTKIFVTKEFATDQQVKKGESRKGLGVEIMPAGAKVGIALPVVATLKTGLEIRGEGETATSENLGKTVYIELLPEKLKSKKGQDAWHFLVGIGEETPA
jgi:hypothetical protein